MGRIILPPSIGHGEGSARHRTASSFATLPSTCSRPSIVEVLALILVEVELSFLGGREKRERFDKRQAIKSSAFAESAIGSSKPYCSVD
jgi:hypothetical protein